MNSARFKSIIIPILLIFSPFLASNVNAQNISLTAIPPRIEIDVKPGQTITETLKVRNESNSEKSLKVTVKDFTVKDDIGTPIPLDEKVVKNNRWAASNWIQVSPSVVKLKPGETKGLTLTVIAPKNASPGGHYAMIIHSPDSETNLINTGAKVDASVGTLVYITVPGQIKQNAFIKEFTAPRFLEFGPVDFKTTINNISDIHIKPVGSIAVSNWIGGKTADLILDETNIFPYTSRDFQNQLGKKWLFGRYKAQLAATYGTAGGTLVATVFFWVIPWKLLILLVLAIILIVAIVALLKNKPQDTQPATVEELEKELEELKNKYKDKN